MKYSTGAIVNRQLKDKRNYSSEELALSPFVNWKELDRNNTKHYSVFNQGSVGACVAHSISKIAEIQHLAESGIHITFDPTFIYTQRSNTTPGMGANDSCKIAQQGCCPLISGVNQPTKESEAIPNTYFKKYSKEMEFSAQAYRLGKYFWLKNDIDEIASAIDTYGAVMVWFSFGKNNNWWSEKPVVASNTRPYKHSVVAVDYGIEDGEKCLVIEDSSGPETGFNGNQRIITNEFIKNNCVVAIAFACNIDSGELDTAHFLYDLEFGSRDVEVARLQSVLRELGHFPQSVSSTGYYGTITKKAVLDFQLEWNVLSSENDAGAGRLGPLTRKTLNDLLQTNLWK